MTLRERFATTGGNKVARILGGSAFIFSSRMLAAVLGFVTQLLLARWMGAAEFGSYVLAYSWLIMLAVFPVAGYAMSAVRFIGQGLAENDPGYTRGFVRHAAVVVLVSSTSIAVVGAASIQLLPDLSSESRWLFIAAMAGVPFFALIRLAAGVALAASKFGLSFLPGYVARPGMFLVALIIFRWVADDLDPVTVMVIQLGTIVLVALPTALLTRNAMRKLLPAAAPKRDTREWVETSISLLILALFTNYFQQITIVVTGFFLPSEDIGVYSVGYQIAMFTSFLLFAVDAYAAPALARHHASGDRTELVSVLRQTTLLRFILMVLAVAFLALFGRPLLQVFGEEFVSGHAVMVILALAQVSHGAVGPVARLLGITGLHNHGLYASAIALAVWFLLAAALMPTLGILGVSISVFLAWTAWAGLLRHFVKRHLGIDTLIFVRDLRDTSPQG